jgi:two-component system NtrC family sensor kinase
VDRLGLYQTTPRVGSVLDRAPLDLPETHTGLGESRVRVSGVDKLRVTAWINRDRWLLVVQQDLSEVRAPVRKAIATGALVSSVAVLLVVVTTFLATRLLQQQIDRANHLREEMTTAFIRSAKLASVGELATGLAHEINNPLAIISAEQTNLADLVDMGGATGELRDEMVESIGRIRAQVQRCGGVTRKMLQFGRTHESSPEPTELAPRLQDCVALMSRQASVRNVALGVDVEPDLPRVLIDPLELEQVLVNLITNSFHALPKGGAITLAARGADNEVWLEVRDTGQGMPPAVRDRVFEPFFTTKPVGEGTGLGLAVCYGIVTSWGGTIEVDSAPGEGTTVRLRLLPVDVLGNGTG